MGYLRLKLVHDHFDLLVPLIEKHRGSVVKTIGDAVMAAFADDLDGIAASLAILKAFHARSDELVLAARFADQAIAAGALDASLVVERYRAELKGVETPIEMARIRLPA